MPDNLSVDVKLEATGSGPVILPNGASAAHAQFSRDGMDLFLTSPGGHAIRIEGYFAHDPAPDLVSADGGRLSPQMVDAFLPPQHPHEVAANAAPAANDASAVGKVTEVTGNTTITHADGSHARIETGMAVHMGDVIQTSAKGAVHILFSDNTTFAVSESARLSIDNYTYNPQEHTGTSFFSMLHGVFVYTSGLIGKNDPGSVNIETPVGSIGIRGTVIAGHINDAGVPSTVTIVDGAIVVTNGGGTLALSTAFDTATLTGYSTAPASSGVLAPQSFNTSYSAVAPADPGFYGLTGATPPAHGVTTPAVPAPQTTTPAVPDAMTMTTPPPAATATPTVATTAALAPVAPLTVTDPHSPGLAVAPTVALTDPALLTPPSATTFTTAAATFGTTPSSTTTFATVATPLTTAGGTLTPAGATLSVAPTAPITPTTVVPTNITATPPSAQFLFSDPYLNGTPGNPADDGIPLLGNILASETMNLPWGPAVSLGTVATTGMTAPTFSLAGPGVVANAVIGGWDIVGNSLTGTQATTGIVGSTAVTAGATIMHIDISAAGAVTLSFGNNLGVIPYIQTLGFFQNFSITATDTGGITATTPAFGFQFQPGCALTAPTVLLGDQIGTNDFISATGPGDYIVLGKSGNDTIFTGGSGNSLVFGGSGNDTLTWTGGGGTVKMYGGTGADVIVMQNPSFLSDGVSSVDGGTGINTLQVGVFTGQPQTYNFEGSGNVTNIETLQIAGGLGTINTVRLDFKDVFDMSPTHTLTIQNLTGTPHGSTVIIDTLGELTAPAAVAGAALSAPGITTLTGQLLSNGQTVTLIIDKGNALPADGIAVTLN